MILLSSQDKHEVRPVRFPCLEIDRWDICLEEEEEEEEEYFIYPRLSHQAYL